MERLTQNQILRIPFCERLTRNQMVTEVEFEYTI